MLPEHHLRNSFHSLRSDVDIRVSDNSEVISTLVRVTIICACFMVIELIGGYWANSVAVISDALHLSIDIIGYAIQITSAKLATKKSNKTMNFGYYRFEPIGAVLNCFTIWLLTVYLVFESYSRILTPPKHFQEGIMLFTAAFGVAANMAMAAVIHGPGIILTMFKYPFMSAQEKDNMMIQEGQENLNIRTVMAHINGDLVYSVGVLLAAVLINVNTDWKILDPLLTILFSFVVLHITLPVFKDSMTIIFEANCDGDRYDTITKEIYGLDKVNKINSLRLWSLTQDQICATVHVTANEGTDEQSLQHKIGKILQKNEVNFWAVQVWKSNFQYACCFTESHEQT